MNDVMAQMFRLPVSMFGYSAEMVTEAVRGMQRVLESGIESVFGSASRTAEEAGGRPQAAHAAGGTGKTGAEVIEKPTQGARPQAASKTRQESDMPDTNLSDDMIKLVEYTIVNTARDREGVIFGPRQVTETKNRTGESFSSAKIAEFFETHLPEMNRERADRKQPPLDYDADDLEVFYRVLDRWPKQSRRYERRQLDRLEEIRDAIREMRGSVK